MRILALQARLTLTPKYALFKQPIIDDTTLPSLYECQLLMLRKGGSQVVNNSIAIIQCNKMFKNVLSLWFDVSRCLGFYFYFSTNPTVLLPTLPTKQQAVMCISLKIDKSRESLSTVAENRYKIVVRTRAKNQKTIQFKGLFADLCTSCNCILITLIAI